MQFGAVTRMDAVKQCTTLFFLRTISFFSDLFGYKNAAMLHNFSVSLRIQKRGHFVKKQQTSRRVHSRNIPECSLFSSTHFLVCFSCSFHWRQQDFIRPPSVTTEEKIWAKLTSLEKVNISFIHSLSHWLIESFAEFLARWLSNWD